MANKLDNLKKGKKFRSGDEATRKAGQKGGIQSGVTRNMLGRGKAMLNTLLFEEEYTNKSTGAKMTGFEGLLRQLIRKGFDPKDKDQLAAIKYIFHILGFDVSEVDEKIQSATASLMQAKADMLTGADTSTLDRLDEILSEMKENADIKQQTE